MSAITRRSALGLTGAGMTAALAGLAAPAAAEPVVDELPIDKANRLAWELADTLNTYLGGRFYAEVYPSLPHDYPVGFISIKAREEAKTVISRELAGIIETVEQCASRITETCLYDEDEPFLAACDAQDEAVLALCAYVPLNAAETGRKGEALQAHIVGGVRFSDEEQEALTGSLIAAGGRVA